MDQQDQESSQGESNQDRDEVNRRQEPPLDEDEKAGSVSSSGRIVVRLKVPPEMVGPTPPPPEKSHFCKECDKAFSSGKALGGHMSSAHVQPNKDHYSSSSSSRKLKSKTDRKNRFEDSGPYSGRAWKGGGGNVCVVCDKRFPTHKSLYGHMRCHPGRGWKGVEPPMGPRVDLWVEESTEHVSEYTGLDRESGDDDDEDYREYVDSGLDYVPGPVDLLSSLGRVPAAAKRGRSVRTEVVSGLEEQEQAVAAGHQLLRLLKRGDLDSGKKTGGDADQGLGSDTVARDGLKSDASVHFKKHLLYRHGSESDAGVRFKKQSLARNEPGSDGGVRFKKLDNPDYSAKKPIVCGIEAIKPNTDKQDLKNKKAPDSKRQKVAKKNGKNKIAYKGQSKTKINSTRKGKAILSESDESDDTTSDDDELYFSAIEVLTNVGEPRRPGYRIPAADVSARSKPVEKPSPARKKENSSSTSCLSSSEKFVCTTCKKVFPTHQALGGHRSSHNKFKIHIVNTIDEVKKPAKGDNVANVGRRENVEDDGNNPHVCNICNKRFATGRALGGHKKRHNSDAAGTSNSNNNNNNNNNNNGDEEKEKVVRAFDLNLMPDESEDDDMS